jgi:TM2 domain-containing membrane protein YozV
MNSLPGDNGKSPVLAAILSALVCGLGQVYNGRVVRGIVLFALICLVFVLGIVLGAFTFGLGLVPFAIAAGAIWIFGVLDAFTGSRRANRA